MEDVLKTSSIKVDLLSNGKHRALLPISGFKEPPRFRKDRIHLCEDTSSLWPLIANTVEVCTTPEGVALSDEERFEVFASERPAVARWVHTQLRDQFRSAITVSEITAANCPANKAVLNDYGDHKQALRYAGMDQPAPFYGKQDPVLHCDYGEVAATVGNGHGVQVNLWLNLRNRPITDFMLGFVVWEKGDGGGDDDDVDDVEGRSKKRARGESLLGSDGAGEAFFPTTTTTSGSGGDGGASEKKHREYLEASLGLRVWPGMTRGQGLLFQATGAEAVVHGSCRYADEKLRTREPRMSLEYRFMQKLSSLLGADYSSMTITDWLKNAVPVFAKAALNQPVSKDKGGTENASNGARQEGGVSMKVQQPVFSPAVVQHLDDESSSDSDNDVVVVEKKSGGPNATTTAADNSDALDPEEIVIRQRMVIKLIHYAKALRAGNNNKTYYTKTKPHSVVRYRDVPLDIYIGGNSEGIHPYAGFEAKDMLNKGNSKFLVGKQQWDVYIVRKKEAKKEGLDSPSSPSSPASLEEDLHNVIKHDPIALDLRRAYTGEVEGRIDTGMAMSLMPWEQVLLQCDPAGKALMQSTREKMMRGQLDAAPVSREENSTELLTVMIQCRMIPRFAVSRRDVVPGYNSKERTGMNGLENLGATCYLNALLQMLYNINEFRAAVYQIPHAASENLDESVAFNLQSVFRNLQLEKSTVTTKDLTRAFGWTTAQAYMQQDAQEMMRVLLEKLEERMKGTPVEGTVARLFSGKLKQFIRCVNVPMESSREEEFSDIQLDVTGCADIYASLKKYVEKERLEGENQYDAGPQFGKQDAEKGSSFLKFPPVLTIQLKRFDFDLNRMCFVKVHDEYKFPAVLDLSEYVDKEEGNGNGDGGPDTYLLHSVLVHRGDVGGGHYYAYIRPNNATVTNTTTTSDSDSSRMDAWFRFDDEKVLRVSDREAVDFNFGRSTINTTSASAYMLVYIKQSHVASVMKPVVADTLTTSAFQDRAEKQRLKKEQEEGARNQLAFFAQYSFFSEEAVAAFTHYGTFHELVRPSDQLQVLNLFKDGTTFYGILFALLKRTGRLLCHFRVHRCGRQRLPGCPETSVMIKKVLDPEYVSLTEQLASKGNGGDTSPGTFQQEHHHQKVDDFKASIQPKQIVYMDSVDSGAWSTDIDITALKTRQADLLKRDNDFCAALRAAMGLHIPGMAGENFDCIGDNSAATAHFMLMKLKAAGCPGVPALIEEKKVIMHEFHELVLENYGHSITHDNDKQDGRLVFVRVFDPEHSLPLCDPLEVPQLEGLSLPPGAKAPLLPVKYLGSTRYPREIKLIEIAKDQLLKKLVCADQSQSQSQTADAVTATDLCAASQWQLSDESRVSYTLQKGSFLWDSAAWQRIESQREGREVRSFEVNNLSLGQAIFLLESETQSFDSEEGFTLVVGLTSDPAAVDVDVAGTATAAASYASWYRSMSQRAVATLSPYDVPTAEYYCDNVLQQQQQQQQDGTSSAMDIEGQSGSRKRPLSTTTTSSTDSTAACDSNNNGTSTGTGNDGENEVMIVEGGVPAKVKATTFNLESDLAGDTFTSLSAKLILRLKQERIARGVGEAGDHYWHHLATFLKMYVSWEGVAGYRHNCKALVPPPRLINQQPQQQLLDLPVPPPQQEPTASKPPINPYFKTAQQQHGKVIATLNDHHADYTANNAMLIGNASGGGCGPIIYYRRTPVATVLLLPDSGSSDSTTRVTPRDLGIVTAEVVIVDARIKAWRKLYLQQQQQAEPESKRRRQQGSGNSGDNVSIQLPLYIPTDGSKELSASAAAQRGVKFPADYRQSNTTVAVGQGRGTIPLSRLYDLTYSVHDGSVNVAADTATTRTVGDFTRGLHAQLGLPEHLHAAPAPADANRTPTTNAAAEADSQGEGCSQYSLETTGSADDAGAAAAAAAAGGGGTGAQTGLTNLLSAAIANEDYEARQAIQAQGDAIISLPSSASATSVPHQQQQGGNYNPQKQQQQQQQQQQQLNLVCSEEDGDENPFPLLLFTINASNLCVRTCSPGTALKISAWPFAEAWFDNGSISSERSSRSSYLSVQHVTREEQRLMRNVQSSISGGRKSMIVLVYSFTLLGSGAKGLSFDDLDAFARPFFTYVSEDCTYDDLSRRVGAIAGEDSVCMQYRLAVVNGNKPHFILRGGNNSSSTSTNTGRGNNREEEECGGGLVWSRFAEVFPTFAEHPLEAVVLSQHDQSQGSRPAAPEWFPPVLGIQRSASHTSKRRGADTDSSIKIA